MERLQCVARHLSMSHHRSIAAAACSAVVITKDTRFEPSSTDQPLIVIERPNESTVVAQLNRPAALNALNDGARLECQRTHHESRACSRERARSDGRAAAPAVPRAPWLELLEARDHSSHGGSSGLLCRR